jgi:hypothetical protein
MPSDDFYEEDEPVEQVVQAFEQGDKQLTAGPSRGVTQTLDMGIYSALARSRTEYLDVPGATLTLTSEQPTVTSQSNADGLAA